jgi:hypothetical protein
MNNICISANIDTILIYSYTNEEYEELIKEILNCFQK